jgi:hypothetical protein
MVSCPTGREQSSASLPLMQGPSTHKVEWTRVEGGALDIGPPTGDSCNVLFSDVFVTECVNESESESQEVCGGEFIEMKNQAAGLMHPSLKRMARYFVEQV